MKTVLSIISIVAIILLGIIIWSWSSRLSIRSGESYIIELTDLPTNYCPNQALYAVTSNDNDKVIVYEGVVTIQECREIKLPIPSVERSWNVYIQLPKSLWSSLNFQGFGTQSLIPIVGDANNDNMINNTDERLLSDQLFIANQDLTLDLNQDGRINSYDLALTRLRFGVGANRPDGASWPKESKR